MSTSSKKPAKAQPPKTKKAPETTSTIFTKENALKATAVLGAAVLAAFSGKAAYDRYGQQGSQK